MKVNSGAFSPPLLPPPDTEITPFLDSFKHDIVFVRLHNKIAKV